MASPLKTGKQSVNLAAPVRRSRIRRDPPPVAKKVDPRKAEERETQMVIIGVVAFALAIAVITIGFASANGWSLSEYSINLSD